MADEEVKETAPAAAEAAAPAEEKVKKGKKRVDVQGIACVNASFNNTIVSITDAHGNVVAWGSPGNSGFKGSRKSTSYVAQIIAGEVELTDEWWNSFVKRINDMGADQLLDVYRQALERTYGEGGAY